MCGETSRRRLAASASDDLEMTDAEFRSAAKLRLGLPEVDPMPEHCPCGASLHTDPTHGHSCRDLTGRAVRLRHDRIVRNIADLTRRLGGTASVEPYSIQHDHGARPDAKLFLRGKELLVDVSVTHPLCESAMRTRKPAEARENRKSAQYRAMATTLHTDFQPFVMETYGYIPPTSFKLLKDFLWPTARDMPGCGFKLSDIVRLLSKRATQAWQRRVFSMPRMEFTRRGDLQEYEVEDTWVGWRV